GVWNYLLLAWALLLYASKTYFNYFRTRDKYDSDLTRNLYMKNLDNNAGVLYRVFNEAEEQELCESILGYTVLLQEAPDNGLTTRELDRKCERILKKHLGSDIDFDVSGSLAKLQRLGLAEQGSDERWTASHLDTASARLALSWQDLFHRASAQKNL
ncbi:MAG: DUF3754 domain-containing protein, partial [Planctomycetota bacterium]